MVINIVISLLLIFFLVFLGQITYALRKFLSLITTLLLKFLSFFGIRINRQEKHVKVSNEFKETYKEIKVVKKANKNLSNLSSIDWKYLATFIIALLLVIINFNSISGNAISNWIYDLFKPLGIITSKNDANVFFTAILFSIISFSLTRLLTRWKETKQQRKEKKINRLKQRAVSEMDSKELLDAARLKNEESYKRLK